MNKMAFNSVLIASLTLGLSLPSHAGLFGSKKESPSYDSSAVSQLAALKAQGMSHDFEPIEVGRLKNADCADLTVYASNAKREMQNLLDQADQHQAQQSSQGDSKKSGGLFSGLVSVASLGAKTLAVATGGPAIMGLANMGGQLTSSLTSHSSNKKAQAAQQAAAHNASEAQANYIVRKYKKHEADLENIQVYQNSKQCL
ncbi:hypothetical protein [Acinetobacter lanii]|uniref:Uncharacterized protein n=1 Tax=Acinetobacter lanii TaxID=2715163 RepID=A0A6G8S3K6_9GAMM|nr:hypothetical protein [Acinetobacter lanii]QIO08588.1 hypothetical protein G8D99_05850 [Acinetobacter lanii]